MNQYSLYLPIYSSPSFTLARKKGTESLRLIMQMHGKVVNTRELPHTYSFLSTFCPEVLTTECFNYDHLPFIEEVKHTEIGHLFEHLLLSYYCQEKIKIGLPFISVDGRTSWNWKRDPWGMFHIHFPHITLGEYGKDETLSQSIEIIESLLNINTNRAEKYFFRSVDGKH